MDHPLCAPPPLPLELGEKAVKVMSRFILESGFLGLPELLIEGFEFL